MHQRIATVIAISGLHLCIIGCAHGQSIAADQASQQDLTAGRYQVAVQLDDGGRTVLKNIGAQAFNAAFAQCPVVRYLRRAGDGGVELAHAARF